jgi:peptide methionine sulfoxide reductase MsrB
MEGLSGTQLLDAMQSLLWKGITSGRKGNDKIVGETQIFRDEKLRFEEENRTLREENENLKNQSKQLSCQVQDLTDRHTKQKSAMDDLKKETERDLQCYELCHTKLHDAMDQFDAQEVQISTRDALIEELKRQKADLEKTLENNESYCHQRGMHLAHTFLWVLEQYNTKTQTFRVTDNIIVFIPGRIMN